MQYSKGNAVQENDVQHEVDLISILHQLLAKKWFILGCACVFAAVALIYAQTARDEYTASSVVQIEKRASNIALPSELIGELLAGVDQESELQTEFHVIKSRLTLGEVVRALDLNVTVTPVGPPFIQDFFYRYSYLLQDFDFLATVRERIPSRYAYTHEVVDLADFENLSSFETLELLITAEDQGRYLVSYTDPITGVMTQDRGTVGVELVIEGLARIFVEEIRARPGAQFEVTFVPVRFAAARLAKNLNISERGGRSGTGIVDFSVTAYDPEASISIVNAVVREYQRQSLNRRSAEVDQSIGFIEEQLPIADANLQSALQAFNSYIDSSGAYASLSATTQDVLARIVELETKLEEIGFQKSQLATQVTESHPDFQRLVAQEQEFEQRLLSLRGELDSVPETEQQLAQLTKNVQAARELKEQLLLRLDQLRIVKASAVGTIRVLETAEDALLSGPNRMNPIALAIVLGVFSACCVVLLRNALKHGIEDEREIEKLGLSVFATIPLVEGLRKSNANDKNYTLAISQPENLATESLRALRTGLHFSLAANNAKAIAITSAAPNEGKSFISLNLAIIAAQAGSKVLLIDSDLRRGELHKPFGLSRKTPGLANFLAGGGDVGKFIHHSARFDLDFIPTGGYPPNPSELLSTINFQTLISASETEYDLIIFDCAPILAVTDPAIVAGSGISSFLAISHLRTTTAEIEASVKVLETVNASFSGVILNSYDQNRSRYGSYSTRYGYYRGSYRYQYGVKKN
ncbi:polysaccharide biosynthesis tyrosine autokinase [Donghicola eburneus]|uniref:polysaccharide biosynthesis tyrosine autokinase n=1 Tax=Donghicola eburneus TaxID=393278 RepID=UPI0008E980D0|nr:polysaccharide biosynthesis tyrosine autokinase [Donghicola eburneus]SFQ78694.1 tyrosine-protein kinase Etk/Wzc [Donghicola eburneus]